MTSKDELLKLLGGNQIPDKDQFRELVLELDSHKILAKVFLLEGVPYVFKGNPMKYVVFREQIADQFDVGSQDVCIVGSAKLGYSPSPHKFGDPFEESSDVDVVIVSDSLFQEGSHEIFSHIDRLSPNLYEIRPFLDARGEDSGNGNAPVVALSDWKTVKEAVRNFVYQNFNPGLLPFENHLRREIFESIGSTAGLFLALEPKVFVSKIRGRIFRTWKAAEDYYSNSLRETKRILGGDRNIEPEIEDAEPIGIASVAAKTD